MNALQKNSIWLPVLSFVVSCTLALAQTGECPDIPLNPTGSGPAAGSALDLLIVSPANEFSEDEMEGIQASFSVWGQAFGLTFTQYQIVQTEPSSLEGKAVVVRDPTVANYRMRTNSWLVPGSDTATGVRVGVGLAPFSTSEHVRQLVVHEVGHFFFLGDCDGCDRTMTAMNPDLSWDTSQNLQAPSECDMDAVLRHSVLVQREMESLRFLLASI